MAKKIAWTVVFCLAAALLQSTLLSRLALYRAVPDLALAIIVYTAYINGTMTGQLSGFFAGFLQDLLSASPLGFNAFIRTLVGALAGLLKGAFFLDFFLLPMALCLGATLLKALIVFLLHLVLSGAVPSYNFVSPSFWCELGLNTLTAPVMFGFLRRFSSLFEGRRES
jgi:rod shape-determining protein MreD